MSRDSAVQTRGFAAVVLLFAACAAALLAHVAIDIAGDSLLAHDAYDGVDHASRVDVFAFALTLIFGGGLRFFWSALDEARRGRASMRGTFDGIFGRTAWPFVFAVATLAVPALMSMELFDVVSGGGRVDDPGDLLGGCALLGLSITLPLAALVAVSVRYAARRALRSHRSLVAVLGRLIALLVRAAGHDRARPRRADAAKPLQRRSVLARRCGKRGPPLPAF